MFLYVYLMYVYVGMHVMVLEEKSKDNVQFFLFYHLGPLDRIQVINLYNRHCYTMSYFTDPKLYLLIQTISDAVSQFTT